MPKFHIIVQEIVNYEVSVTARSEKHAREKAEAIIADADDLNKYFAGVEERDIVLCEKIEVIKQAPSAGSA